jgi:hypothetical protein
VWTTLNGVVRLARAGDLVSRTAKGDCINVQRYV